MSKVSVIVPNFNHSEFLRKRIDSILQQSFQDFELIIIDDCSTDDSKKIIEEYRANPKIKHIIYNKNNSGSTFIQWKKGIELANGEWIWIAESDDFAHPDFLKILLSENEMIDAPIRYCNSQIIDSHSNPSTVYGFTNMPSKEVFHFFRTNFSMTGMKFINDWMLTDNFIPNASAVIFRTNVVNDFSVFKDLHKLRLMGDWLFWLRILRNNSVYYHADQLNFYRNHSQNVRSKAINLRTIEFGLILDEFPNNQQFKQKLFNAFLYRYLSSPDFNHFKLLQHLKIFNEAVKHKFVLLYIKSIFRKLID